jgi:DNA polymerase I
MDIELHPAVSLQENTLNVLVAPPELLIEAINSNLNLQRYKVLFISGNYSRILSRLDRNFTELEVRRAFTFFKLMTLLEENHHSLLINKQDPTLCEDASEMVEYAAQSHRQTSREATILLYSPALGPHLQKLTELADRVFCFYEGQQSSARGRTKGGGENARIAGHPRGDLMIYSGNARNLLCHVIDHNRKSMGRWLNVY